jgi:formylglycine-generating enzyme required for sulfatase activity
MRKRLSNYLPRFRQKKPLWYTLLLIVFTLTTGILLWQHSPELRKIETAKANNISATNISITSNGTTKKATITFTVAWDNSYNLAYDGQLFKDQAWIFIKYSTQGGADGTWHHATLTTGGTVTPTADGKGAFVDPGANQTVVWNYGGDGLSNGYAKIRIGALEMVKIPTGQFWYNAAGIGGSSYNNFGGGSEALVASINDKPAGTAANWPNGYNAFYLAKYEVSQGQYVDYLNTLSSGEATSVWASCGGYRNTVTYTAGNAYGSRYATTTPNRAMNCVSWGDAEAYSSWVGLRPMTEMEYEKAGRGTSVGQTNKNTYPWGMGGPDCGAYTWDGASIPSYYTNCCNLAGGPVDVGHYLSKDITRSDSQTGASPYGVADLAGNLWEQVINNAWTKLPANGNGTISPPASWPTASAGRGVRGGGWNSYGGGVAFLRLSDRIYAGDDSAGRSASYGIRPARTVE